MMTVPPAFAWSRRARAMMRRLSRSRALRGLVEQQQLGADQQQLCQCEQLALPAREVVRVASSSRPVQPQARRTPPRHSSRHIRRLEAHSISSSRHRLGNQQCFGILRQQRHRGRPAHHATALQLGSLRQHRKHRRLAAAVTAHNRMHRASRKRRIEPAQHPAGRSIVAKPAFRQGGSRPSRAFFGVFCFHPCAGRLPSRSRATFAPQNSDDLSNSELFFALDMSPGGFREPKLSSRLLNTPFFAHRMAPHPNMSSENSDSRRPKEAISATSCTRPSSIRYAHVAYSSIGRG